MDTIPDKNKRANIHDVAREAGASAATVSRVLNDSKYPVRDEIRQRILKAAKKLKYTPNILGRMLKKNETREVGVIIPTITNPFYSQIVLGIEVEARRRGYGLLLCNTFRDCADERRCIESLFQKQVRGIALSTVMNDLGYLNDMLQKGLRIVLIDQETDDIECGRIGFNYIRGGVLAARHLLDCGHRNIVFLSPPLNKSTRTELLAGFTMAHSMCGVEFHAENVIADEQEEDIEGIYEFECGKRLVGRMLALKNRPTAIFAVNDMLAFGIMQELAALGFVIPDDFSIIGFDNIQMSSLINPPLTTINQSAMETGKFVCKTLIDMIEEHSGNKLSLTLEPTLVVRKSVKTILT